MKANFIYLVLLIVYVSLTACAGDAVDLLEEGIEFTEEEAVDILNEQGY